MSSFLCRFRYFNGSRKAYALWMPFVKQNVTGELDHSKQNVPFEVLFHSECFATNSAEFGPLGRQEAEEETQPADTATGVRKRKTVKSHL